MEPEAGDTPLERRCSANPRLTDVLDLPLNQAEVDFVIPHLQEDIPLCIDPFLLWKSGREEYRLLHSRLLAFFDKLRLLMVEGRVREAERLLAECSEPTELGLGYALGSTRGSAMGPYLARQLLGAFECVPQFTQDPVQHIETLSLLVPGVAEDRVSDLTASVLKGFLVEFTQQRAEQNRIPMKLFPLPSVLDHDGLDWRPLRAALPYNPLTGSPLLFAPLDLLRHLPWINYEDYYKSAYAPYVLPPNYRGRRVDKRAVIAHNRDNYVEVKKYIAEREQSASLCKPDPLFQPLQVATLQRKLASLRLLATGRQEGSDKKYESLVFDLLSSLLYPELEFAKSQVRTESGAHIRDIIFYNDGKTEFLKDIRSRFGARQLVFEMKNVGSLSGEHVNQLYRYLDEEFGRLGVIVTRSPPAHSVRTNIVDLHSSKRAAVLWLDDSDIALMVQLLESGRRPVEALKKRFVEFTRLLPK